MIDYKKFHRLEEMITVQNISKYFGNTPALDNVSFEIAKGEIVGFLGPNGAGKTTLMRILTGYLPATTGKASIAGFDLAENPTLAKQKIGYLPETPPLYPDMSVYDYLKFAAKMKDVNYRDLNVQIDKTLEACDLKNVRRSTIATLSKGYQQRVGIAQAIINDPEVLILDEPTNGLDPLQILQVRKLIKNVEAKRTVILSTHILSEIEQMAERVIIIQNGKIAADDKLSNLLHNPGNPQVRLKLEDVFLKLTAEKTETL